MTTAFHPDGALDIASTVRVFQHALNGGVDAVFVNGTTGEFAALTPSERRQLLAEAVAVAGADRVVAHVGAASPWETARLTADAASLGISKLSILTPFYMPASVDGVRAQVRSAQDAAPGSEFFLYLFPDRTGVHLPAVDAVRIIEEFDLAGAKISIAGTDYLAELAFAAPGRVILSGNDGLLREVLAAGGAGIVSGVSSSTPAPFVALADAIQRDDQEAIGRASAQVDAVVPILGTSIAGLKLSQLEQGLIRSSGCRMAIDPVDAQHREQIRKVLALLSPDTPVNAT
ncbi:dihydrodipicolinate synthase family protein [Microbacterium tumbae]